MSLDSSTPNAETSTAVACPGCGANVHTRHAAPGAKIHCLNCGARFVPGQTTASAEPLRSTTPLQETPPPIREPRSAGYWYLRIPAMVYFAAAVLIYLISVSSIIYNLFTSRGRYFSWEQFFISMVYLPLLPLSGYFGFVVTRSLARLEAHSLKAAWNEKLIQTSLPAVKGSSLPYLLPLSVGPVVIFIVSAVAMGNDSGYRIRETAIYSGVAAVVCFILAFMMDDLRQFLWRQQSIATEVAPNSNPSKSRIAWIGLLPALILVTIALSFVAVYYDDIERAIRYSRNRHVNRHVDRDFSIQIMTALTLCACALTFYLTGRNFKTATRAWRSAADAQLIENNLLVWDMAERRVHFVLELFVLVGAGALLLEFQKYQNFGVRSHAATWLGVVMLFTWSLCLIFQKDSSDQRRTVIRLDNLPFLAIAIGAMVLPILIKRESGKEMSDETVGFVALPFSAYFTLCIKMRNGT